MTGKSGTSNIISLPTGGGALSGIGEKFSPDLFTGTGNFTIPITLPPGRHGFQPQLNLIYSTGNGNGAFGLGWNLSVPGVHRKISKGVPRYDEAKDIFILSGAEDLVAIETSGTTTRYRPRTEGLFAQILYHRDASNSYWEVRSKDGLVSFYGTQASFGTDPAVIADPSIRSHVFAWKLTRTEDPFGNRIEYEYERDTAEDGPHHWDQLDLARIRYVDYGEDNANPQFLVTVEFVYELRPDPHSEYRSGFEIRTRKRCTHIVVHTHAGEDRLVRTYELIYLDRQPDSTIPLPLNSVSLLSQVKVMGHNGDQTETLPLLEFRYTTFDPNKRHFFPLQGSALPAQSLSNPDLEFVDLFGNGLPDLIEMNGTTRYWKNLGGGCFDLPRFMQDAPGGLRLADAGVQLIDANGDGQPDLLITNGTVSGYFPLRFGGQWARRSFQRYHQAPSFNLEDSEVKLVDLDGDGVTDAIRSGSRLECFFNDPKEGWNHTRWVERQALEVFPNVNFSDPRVKWADFTGDGLQDIALVYDGNVEYWPNLGWGNWGKRIHMQHSPRFPFGYDPKRILVGDVDGDGLADIVYVEDNRVTLWINQSGNQWSDPITISGTPPVSDADAVRLVDMLGSGISGVLWSRDGNGLSHDHLYFLDFTGSLKPYLLNEMDNHIGALTKIEYAPSTRFYLEDQQRPDTRWKTTLPFPVHVVSRVEVIDHFSKGKLTTEYRYHHGYWDGAEREFRGFGMVEQYDTESFEAYDSSGLHGAETVFGKVDQKYFSPPVLSRSWFHQGPVGDEFGDWQELDWSDQYWIGDRPLLNHTETINQFLRSLPLIPDSRRAKRDALRALRGSMLRTELYTHDGLGREERPYTVGETGYGLIEVEPPTVGDTHRLHIFFAHSISQRTTQWERGDDPMTQFSFTRYTDENDADKFDPFGRPLALTRIACPRGWRNLEDSPTTEYLATRTCTVYARPSDPLIYIHNRVAKVTSYEILNMPGRRVSEFATIKDSNPALKLTGQTLNFYDGEAFIGMALGQIGKFGAVTRSESLALTDELLQQAYDADIPPYIEATGNPIWLAAYPLEFRTLLPPRAGYTFHIGGADQSDPKGYFVNTDRRRYDFQTNASQTGRGLVIEILDPLHEAISNPLGHRTLISHDTYQLLPKEVSDAAGLTIQATYDYRVLQPTQITDPNGNKSSFTFSPLGLLQTSIVRGKNPTEGDQTRASARVEYAFLAFENSSPENRLPIFVRTIRHIHHDTELDVPLPERDETFISIEYSDGFGRLLQTRTQGEEVRFGDAHFGGGVAVLPVKQSDGGGGDVLGRQNDDGNNPNVVVSGWQIYANKGQIVEKYEPFFSEGWDYGQPDDTKMGQKVAMFYDPRGHVVRTLNPDGSEQRVIYGVPGTIAAPDLAHPEIFEPTPWEAYTYDANDNAGRTHAAEASSYQHHWNTPASILIDALGRTIEAVERNRDLSANPGDPLASVQEFRTRMTYDIRGNVLLVIDALGRPAFRHVCDYANHKLRIESIDAGIRKTIVDAAGGVIEQRDSKGALSLHSYDNLNRPIRLWARDGDGQKLSLRERLEYGDAGDPNQADADRVTNLTANRLGRVFRHFDEAGLLTFEAYDFKGNLLEKTRHIVSDTAILEVFNGPPPDWKVDAFRVDWTSPADVALDAKTYTSTNSYDALGRIKLMTYPEDVENDRRKLRPHYNRAGALESVALERIVAGGGTVNDTFVERIAYNAKGQRMLIAYGNEIMTRYAYDPRTFRLFRLRTEGYSKPSALTYRGTGTPHQELAYEYDLVGNIWKIHERTPGCGVMNTPQGADALDREFTYDPLYRLRSASGRECDRPPDAPWDDGPRCTDLTKTRSYTEQYLYDLAGNIGQLKHVAHASGFSRDFDLVPGNNRLRTLTVGATVVGYDYDTNGNMIRENTSRHFEWDYTDRMRVYRTQTDASEPTVHAHYLYDAGGQRVKKLVRKQGGQVEVTVYIDGAFEYQRVVKAGALEENNTLHMMDNKGRIALVRVGQPSTNDTTPAVKYHVGDHLGSSNLVIDSSGNLVNCEEYTPYGETSFGSFARKRYRASGKERDAESSLYNFGLRYYSPWLCRWISCDPIAAGGGLNLYAYVRGNPMVWRDPTGLAPESDNICTPPSHPVSPSANNNDLPNSASTQQTRPGGDSSVHSVPTPTTTPTPESHTTGPVSTGGTGRAASTEVTKPERTPVERPPIIDPPLRPILKRRDDPPKTSGGGGWMKWLFGFGVAAIIIASAPPAVGVGAAAPAAGLAKPSPPVPSTSAPTQIRDLPGIQQATDIETAKRAFSEGSRVGVKVRIGVATEAEMRASKIYLDVYQNTRDAGEAGKAFHQQIGAQPTGADRYFFGSANEVKTKNPFGMVSGQDMINALKQVEGYPSKGPHTVTFFEIGSGNKYIISR